MTPAPPFTGRRRLHLAAALDQRSVYDAGEYLAAARLAERGALDFVTADDGLARPGPDALAVLSRVAPATRRIGLVPTVTTTHTDRRRPVGQLGGRRRDTGRGYRPPRRPGQAAPRRLHRLGILGQGPLGPAAASAGASRTPRRRHRAARARGRGPVRRRGPRPHRAPRPGRRGAGRTAGVRRGARPEPGRPAGPRRPRRRPRGRRVRGRPRPRRGRGPSTWPN